jgi:SAM-dependent methyltransferase
MWCCIGDAENLPFADDAFGVVINIESSHSYPNIRSFFHEVSRVLRPGGHFLYADIIDPADVSQTREYLAGLGLCLDREEDITGNVLLSCSEMAAKRKGAYRDYGGDMNLDEFLAVPGSSTYENMKNGRTKYVNQSYLKVAIGSP